MSVEEKKLSDDVLYGLNSAACWQPDTPLAELAANSSKRQQQLRSRLD